MARTQVAVVQTPWDCRWSQPGHRLTGVDEDHQPEGRWVCTRSTRAGVRRTVTDDECATCAHWEADDTPGPSAYSPAFSLEAVSRHAKRHGWHRVLFVAAGVALATMGIGLGATIVMLPVGAAFFVVGAGIVACGAT